MTDPVLAKLTERSVQQCMEETWQATQSAEMIQWSRYRSGKLAFAQTPGEPHRMSLMLQTKDATRVDDPDKHYYQFDVTLDPRTFRWTHLAMDRTEHREDGSSAGPLNLTVDDCADFCARLLHHAQACGHDVSEVRVKLEK